jgi:hypothetical protein
VLTSEFDDYWPSVALSFLSLSRLRDGNVDSALKLEGSWYSISFSACTCGERLETSIKLVSIKKEDGGIEMKYLYVKFDRSRELFTVVITVNLSK